MSVLLALAMLNLAQKAGHLLRTTSQPYHLTDGCASGGSGPAPCACGYPTGLAATYTVNGAAGITACATCTDATGGTPAWDGTLHHASGCIWWAADASFDPLSIGGKQLDITYTQILLRTNVSPCRWELYIACLRSGFPSPNIWYGYKTTGSTPAGTYSYVGSDCGITTATMTVS